MRGIHHSDSSRTAGSTINPKFGNQPSSLDASGTATRPTRRRTPRARGRSGGWDEDDGARKGKLEESERHGPRGRGVQDCLEDGELLCACARRTRRCRSSDTDPGVRPGYPCREKHFRPKTSHCRSMNLSLPRDGRKRSSAASEGEGKLLLVLGAPDAAGSSAGNLDFRPDGFKISSQMDTPLLCAHRIALRTCCTGRPQRWVRAAPATRCGRARRTLALESAARAYSARPEPRTCNRSDCTPRR